jgi:hypothetical protein
MLKRGELDVKCGADLQAFGTFPNLARHLDFLNEPCKAFSQRLDKTEEKLFSHVTDLTSSGQFVKAFTEKNFALCTKIATAFPMAIRARSEDGKKSVVHVAVYDNNLESLKFLAGFAEVDWNMWDSYGETPLMRCIRHGMSDEIACWLMENGADVD